MEVPRPSNTPIDFAAMTSTMDTSTSHVGAGGGYVEQAPRRLRPVWLVVAILLFVGGAGSLVYGIVDIVRQNDAILDEAVAEGVAGREPQQLTFIATSSREYSVYALIDTTDSNEQDRIVDGMQCAMGFADGTSARLSGSNQSVSTNIGDTASVGSFDAPEGAVAIACVQQRGRTVRYVVSPASIGILQPIVAILVGAFTLVAAVFATVFAFSGRRRARRRGWTPTV